MLGEGGVHCYNTGQYKLKHRDRPGSRRLLGFASLVQGFWLSARGADMVVVMAAIAGLDTVA